MQFLIYCILRTNDFVKFFGSAVFMWGIVTPTVENRLELSKFLRLNFGGNKEWGSLLSILRYWGHDFGWVFAFWDVVWYNVF